MPRKLFYAVESSNLDAYNPKSTHTSRSTAWAHSSGSRLLTDADGDRLAGDGVRRERHAHPVVAGTALGRPENEYEALMQAQPHEEALQDSEALDASQARVDALLEMLPERHRSVLTLCVLEGLSVREAAEHLSVSRSQVHRDLEKAKAALAELLGGELPTAQTQDDLVEMAPERPPELGEYLQPADHKEDDPEVTAEQWRRYQTAIAAMNQGKATPAELEAIKRFERSVSMPSSFSPGWR